MNNLRMFEVRFIGPSNFRPARVKITDLRHGKSVTLSYDYDYDRASKQAVDYLAKRGIPVVSQAWDEKTKKDYLLSDNFTTDLKGDVK